VSTTDAAAPTGPTALSPSGAALWAQCQQRWWYRYVDHLPEPPPGEPAILGTFVHHILELLLGEPASQRTIERARELARVAWADIETSDDWAALGLSDQAALRFRHRAWATVGAYFAFEDPNTVQPVARELEVRTEVAGVPFRGFIDLVALADAPADDPRPAIVVTDYKTGQPPVTGKPWSDEQLAERLLQPQWYAAALEALGEHRPVKARLVYFTAADDRRGPGFTTRSAELAVDITPESLTHAGAELRRRWDAITTALATGEVAHSAGPLCGWCPFVATCSAGQAECRQRWSTTNNVTGERRLRDDAPAVTLLGLS
jgi:putative RecB family exonuclease